MTENEKTMPSFKWKPRNTTYTVKAHFSKDTDKTFKDRVQRLIEGGCTSGKRKKYPQHTLTKSIRLLVSGYKAFTAFHL